MRAIDTYHIHLKPLEKSDIELVRTWRNSEHVRSNMCYRKTISVSDQKAWFERLDANQHYYLIITENIPIGLINVKDIDSTAMVGEAGVFIGDLKYKDNPIVVNAILALMDYYFEKLHFTALTAKVLKENDTALFMNLELGYQIINTDATCYYLQITPEDYFDKTANFRALLARSS